MQYVARKDGVGSCWRPHTAGLLHAVWDQIQSIQKLLDHLKTKVEEGRGPQNINSCHKVFSRLLLRRRGFALPSLSLILLRFCTFRGVGGLFCLSLPNGTENFQQNVSRQRWRWTLWSKTFTKLHIHKYPDPLRKGLSKNTVKKHIIVQKSKKKNILLFFVRWQMHRTIYCFEENQALISH